MSHSLGKRATLARLDALREVVEGEAIQNVHALAVIDTLLDYLNDTDIRQAVEEIAL